MLFFLLFFLIAVHVLFLERSQCDRHPPPPPHPTPRGGDARWPEVFPRCFCRHSNENYYAQLSPVCMTTQTRRNEKEQPTRRAGRGERRIYNPRSTPEYWDGRTFNLKGFDSILDLSWRQRLSTALCRFISISSSNNKC